MDTQKNYIEEVGLFYEKYGLPKMAGRILGCLLSSTTENISFTDLQEQLKASKGSISGNIQLLLTQQMVEKYMISGDRKSYYRIATNSLENFINAKIESITVFKKILQKGITFGTSANTHLKEIIAYYAFLEAEIPQLKIKWEQQKHKL